MSKLSFILPVAFGAFAAGSVAVLDYYKRSLVAGPEGYSVASYVSEIKDSLSAQTREAVANRKLKDHMGEAPEGWEKRDFERADISIMTGVPLEEPKEVDDGLTKGQRAILSVTTSAVTRGSQSHAYTYQNGDTLVIVQGTFLPARVMKGFGGKQLGMMMDMMNMGGRDFAIIRGLKFDEATFDHDEEAYRKFTAGVGQQIRLTVLSNATDKQLVEVLETLDIAAMNQMLADPIPQMGEVDLVMLASEAEAERAAQYAAATKQADLRAAENAKALAAAIARDARAQTGVEGADAATAEQEAALVPGEVKTEGSNSFIDRLTGFFTGSDSAEDEAPRRMVCTIQKGFKRCVFKE